MTDNDRKLIEDVIYIAKYKLWNTTVGDERAMEIIYDIHNGKYDGKDYGIWPQVEEAWNRIVNEKEQGNDNKQRKH